MSCVIRACRTKPISRRFSYLLFLKMDAERAALVASGLLRGEPSAIPEDCRWGVLRDLQGEELTRRYTAVLDELRARIFRCDLRVNALEAREGHATLVDIANPHQRHAVSNIRAGLQYAICA
jgi:hypothetical protein